MEEDGTHDTQGADPIPGTQVIHAIEGIEDIDEDPIIGGRITNG